MKPIKIALIGAGNVGNSFLYAAMNQGLASEYGIIDINPDFAVAKCIWFWGCLRFTFASFFSSPLWV